MSLDNEQAPSREQDYDHEIKTGDLSRRSVRSLILHLLYAMDSFDYSVSLESVVDNFNRGFELDIDPKGEIVRITQAIINERLELDEIIKPRLVNWRFERVGVCTKLILRFAVWEMKTTDTGSNIIINEAIELAKCFAEADAYKFVNGLLDEVVKAMGREDLTEPAPDKPHGAIANTVDTVAAPKKAVKPATRKPAVQPEADTALVTHDGQEVTDAAKVVSVAKPKKQKTTVSKAVVQETLASHPDVGVEVVGPDFGEPGRQSEPNGDDQVTLETYVDLGLDAEDTE